MLFIAHRGYSSRYRDNSIDGIQAAIEQGYDGVEIDVQLCLDGRIVLYHDIYAGDRFISETTYEELSTFSGIQSLEELYDEVPAIEHTLLLVDIKGNSTDICNALVAFYATRSITDVYFCSFNRKLVYRLPIQFKKGCIFETTFLPHEYDMMIDNLQVVLLHWTCLDEQFIRQCLLRNAMVFAYTHKEPMELKWMNKCDLLNGIVTNELDCRHSSLKGGGVV